MKNLLFYPGCLLLAAFLTGCDGSGLESASLPDGYEESVQEWQEHRIGVLTDTTGWLRLVDLIWLQEGENSFGSGEERDVRFPEGSIGADAGAFILREGEVFMTVNDGVDIYHENERVESLAMLVNEGEDRVHAHHGDLTWFIDSRGDRRGVKVFSMDTPKADNFTGFPRYELKGEWRLKGRFVPRTEDTETEIVNVLGDVVRRRSPGRVEFRIGNEEYSVDVLEATSGLFLMFTDLTNQDETYLAGRYLLIDHPDDDGEVTIDFNMAYNPPCAFNKFTTCQLPPPQNRLDIAIPAGEKRAVDFSGI